jgi:hypothetical protein
VISAESLHAYKARLDSARLLAARLNGQREADERQMQEWTAKVSAAKARLTLADEISRLFEAMQTRAHSRSVGSFEQLLSAVMKDVMPEAGAVRLDLSNSNNTPELDVYIENEGALEDALEGSGGAVTNVLSAGLRFAALARTKNRRLMVLDEPDCWIRPSRVPSFLRMVAGVARHRKIQTLLISHHDPAYFRGRLNLVELSKDDEGVVRAQAQTPVVDEWESAEQPGIRSIRLINFRAHTDTLVPLFPGPTALIGDNDLGKSTALVSSLKAVAYNDSADTVIRHGAKEAKVVIELENGHRVEWVRRRKGSPKVTYAVFHGDTLVFEGKAPGRGSVPALVTEELGICEVDGLDIQIGGQKKPVFLLDEPASRRAKLLSVGRESGYLNDVMTAWGAVKRRDSETVRDGEALLTKLSARLEKLAALQVLQPRLEGAAAQHLALDEVVRTSDRLTRLVAAMGDSLGGVRRMESELAALRGLPSELPVLHEVDSLRALTARLAAGARFVHIRLPAELPRLPELADTTTLARVNQLISGLSRYAAVFGRALPELPELPELADTVALAKMGQRIALLNRQRAVFDTKLPELPPLSTLADGKTLAATVANLDSLLKGIARTTTEDAAAKAEYARNEAELARLKKTIGVCPLCDHEFEEGHTHAHVE